MNIITRILEKLFKLDHYEEPGCANCDHLRLLIEQERSEKNRFISSLIEFANPKKEIISISSEPPQPIKPRYVPFNVRRAEVEALDRKEHNIRVTMVQEADALAREMEIVNAELEEANEKARVDQQSKDGNEEHRAVPELR